MSVFNIFKKSVSKAIEESKDFPPEIGKEYYIENDDPFRETTVVIPVEIKGEYVKYRYKNITLESLAYSSIEIRTFNNVYKPVKLSI